MASPGEQMSAMVRNLEASTGKSLSQWVVLARKSGAARHGALVSWLEQEHGMRRGYANLVAHSTFESDAASRTAAGDDLVEAMFAGEKAILRPIFDALLGGILAFGSDIEQAPKKGYLSLRRSTQFATLIPAPGLASTWDSS